MKIKTLVMALSITGVLAVSAPASAQFGGLGSALGGGKSEAKGDIDGQVKSFMEQSGTTYKLVYNSLKAVEAAYATAEKAAKIQEEVAAFNKSTDPKEQQAKAAEALKTDGALVAELAQSKTAQEDTKNLSKDKQKLLMAGVSNFTIAALGAGNLGKTGGDIVKSVSSNPMSMGKVMPVKDALPILADTVSVSGKLLPALLKVMKGANLSVPEVKAESKPADLSADMFK